MILVFFLLGCNFTLTYGSDMPVGSIGIKFFASLTEKNNAKIDKFGRKASYSACT